MKAEIKHRNGKWELIIPTQTIKDEMVGLNDQGKYYLRTPFYPVIQVTSEGIFPRFWKDFSGATFIAKKDLALFEQIWGQRVMLKQA